MHCSTSRDSTKPLELRIHALLDNDEPRDSGLERRAAGSYKVDGWQNAALRRQRAVRAREVRNTQSLGLRFPGILGRGRCPGSPPADRTYGRGMARVGVEVTEQAYGRNHRMPA